MLKWGLKYKFEPYCRVWGGIAGYVIAAVPVLRARGPRPGDGDGVVLLLQKNPFLQQFVGGSVF